MKVIQSEFIVKGYKHGNTYFIKKMKMKKLLPKNSFKIVKEFFISSDLSNYSML